MELDVVEQVAPGCFGAASVYGSDSQICRACHAFERCGEKSIQTLEAIKASIDVRDLLARHSRTRSMASFQIEASRPVIPSPLPVAQPKQPKGTVERKTPVERVTFHIAVEDQDAIAVLEQKSSKVAKQALVLCKTNKINECRSHLPRGLNPFSTSGPRFFFVACDMLLNGGFTKASLKARLMKEFGWTDNTAGSHVAIAVGVLAGMGIVKLLPDNCILNPELGQ